MPFSGLNPLLADSISQQLASQICKWRPFEVKRQFICSATSRMGLKRSHNVRFLTYHYPT